MIKSGNTNTCKHIDIQTHIQNLWAIVDRPLSGPEVWMTNADRLKRMLLSKMGRVTKYLTICNIKPGTWGKCKGDKKHCYYHWELNYGLNSGLKDSPVSPRFDITKIISS